MFSGTNSLKKRTRKINYTKSNGFLTLKSLKKPKYDSFVVPMYWINEK